MAQEKKNEATVIQENLLILSHDPFPPLPSTLHPQSQIGSAWQKLHSGHNMAKNMELPLPPGTTQGLS